MEILEISSLIQNYTPFVGIILALALGMFLDKKIRFILIFLLASALVNILVVEFGVFFFLGRYLGEIFHVLLSLVLTWTLYLASNRHRSILNFGIALLIIQLTIHFIFQPPNTFPNVSGLVDNLAIIIICFRYFYYLYQSEADINLNTNLSFLITCTTFFYAAGSFFTSLMIRFITKNGGENASLWVVQSSVSIITYLAFAYLIWREHSKETKAIINIT